MQSINMTIGSGYSYARAGTVWCEATPGTLTSKTANQPCIESAGLLVHGAGTNSVVQSETINHSSWLKVGSSGRVPTVTTNYAVADPFGTQVAERLQISDQPGASDYSEVASAAISMTNGQPIAFSAWVRGTSAGCTLGMSIMRSAGPASGCRLATCTVAGTSWQRCQTTLTPNATNTWLAFFGGDKRCSGATDLGACDVVVTAVEVELGTTVAGPYVTTVAAAAGYSATSVSIASLAPVGPRCFSLGIANGSSAAQEALGAVGLWAHDTATGTNDWALSLGSGSFSLAVVDSAAGVRTSTVAGSLVGGSTLVGCTDNQNHYTIWVNGTSQSISTSGAGTGSQNGTASTIYLGELGGGANPLLGHLTTFKECKGKNGAKCL